ncbi:uncharacterized protein CLUP02_12362 [Colletotrichum lupini]|uniref:Uncharacterized protein n=1 Tax=Colletotrichum lupini TaxID=145971 RepID=A0A9Q8T141_9PEZI|nr:uncharacterized protein CLUP02_12362 [Colletotrichum lupini]UQC86860.1 hypothetical protein CLUP02_12362 [Colletotrichum lupini]
MRRNQASRDPWAARPPLLITLPDGRLSPHQPPDLHIQGFGRIGVENRHWRHEHGHRPLDGPDRLCLYLASRRGRLQRQKPGGEFFAPVMEERAWHEYGRRLISVLRPVRALPSSIDCRRLDVVIGNGNCTPSRAKPRPRKLDGAAQDSERKSGTSPKKRICLVLTSRSRTAALGRWKSGMSTPGRFVIGPARTSDSQWIANPRHRNDAPSGRIPDDKEPCTFGSNLVVVHCQTVHPLHATATGPLLRQTKVKYRDTRREGQSQTKALFDSIVAPISNHPRQTSPAVWQSAACERCDFGDFGPFLSLNPALVQVLRWLSVACRLGRVLRAERCKNLLMLHFYPKATRENTTSNVEGTGWQRAANKALPPQPRERNDASLRHGVHGSARLTFQSAFLVNDDDDAPPLIDIRDREKHPRHCNVALWTETKPQAREKTGQVPTSPTSRFSAAPVFDFFGFARSLGRIGATGSSSFFSAHARERERRVYMHMWERKAIARRESGTNIDIWCKYTWISSLDIEFRLDSIETHFDTRYPRHRGTLLVTRPIETCFRGPPSSDDEYERETRNAGDLSDWQREMSTEMRALQKTRKRGAEWKARMITTTLQVLLVHGGYRGSNLGIKGKRRERVDPALGISEYREYDTVSSLGFVQDNSAYTMPAAHLRSRPRLSRQCPVSEVELLGPHRAPGSTSPSYPHSLVSEDERVVISMYQLPGAYFKMFPRATKLVILNRCTSSNHIQASDGDGLPPAFTIPSAESSRVIVGRFLDRYSSLEVY